MNGVIMDVEKNTTFYQQRHRLTIRQIAELREFSGIAIPQISDQPRKIDTMAKVAELIRLSKMFKAHNLEFISIKGPLLSWRLHQDVAVRYTNDLDILVKPEDLFIIIRMLKEDGYQTTHFDLPASGSKKRLLLKLNNHIGLMHPQKKILLEVHWRLMKPEVCSKTKLDQLINQNTESVIFHNESFTVFTKEFELVYLILHGAMHEWFRLKWLHDIVSFSKDEQLDWDRVFELNKDFHGEHLVYQAIQLADKFWDLPPDVAARFAAENMDLNAFMINHPLKSISRTNVATIEPGFYNWLSFVNGTVKYGLMLFPSAKYKYTFLKRLMFREIDMKILKLPDFLTFMYFPLRPFLIVYSRLVPSSTRNHRAE